MFLNNLRTLRGSFCRVIEMSEELKQLYEELHQATRQFLRFNGVDKERAETALKTLNQASFQVTLYLERDQDD